MGTYIAEGFYDCALNKIMRTRTLTISESPEDYTAYIKRLTSYMGNVADTVIFSLFSASERFPGDHSNWHSLYSQPPTIPSASVEGRQ